MSRSGLLIFDQQADCDPPAQLARAIAEEFGRHNEIVLVHSMIAARGLTRFWNQPKGKPLAEVLTLPPGAVKLDAPSGGLQDSQLALVAGLHCHTWHMCGHEPGDTLILPCAFSLWEAGIAVRIRAELCHSALHADALRLAAIQFLHPENAPD